MNILPTATSVETLLEWGNIKITLPSLINAGIIIAVTLLILFLIKKALWRLSSIERGKLYSINRLIMYSVWTFTFIILLQNFGVNLTVLLGASAALFVGVGLGLQNIFSDFVSGLVILVDSSVKVGDIIDVGGMVCQVKEIKLRTTLVVTRDDKMIILPNSQLTKQQLINWSHDVKQSRFHVTIGVDYASDVDLVCKLLTDVAAMHPEVLTMPKPFVRLSEFLESSVIYTLYFWCDNMFRVENVISDIRKNIFRALRENHINIPYPQRVLHYAQDRHASYEPYDDDEVDAGRVEKETTSK